MSKKSNDKSELWYDGKPAKEVTAEAIYWLRRMCSSEEISNAECNAFQEWYSANDSHREVYCELLRNWAAPYLEQILEEKLNALSSIQRKKNSLPSEEEEPLVESALREKKDIVEHTNPWGSLHLELASRERQDILENGFLKKLDWKTRAPVRLDFQNQRTETVLQAIIWFKHIEGAAEPSKSVWQQFQEWYREDAIHLVIYGEVVELWDNPKFQRMLKMEEAINKWGIRIERFQAAARFIKKLFGAPLEGIVCGYQGAVSSWRAVGLTVAAASIFIAVFIWTTNVSDLQPQRTLYETKIGEVRKVTLADGSTVNLDTNARLYVEYDSDVRKVSLNHGAAYFDVVHDGRPFIVEGGTGLVRVMGTAFEVQVNEDHMVVSVERGRVAVSSQTDEQQYVEVTRRRQVEVSRYQLGEVGYQALNTTVADWRDGWLELTNKSLGEAIVELDRYYAGNISLDDEKLANIPVEGSYDVRNIYKAMKMLAMGVQLDYSISTTGDIVFFLPGGDKSQD